MEGSYIFKEESLALYSWDDWGFREMVTAHHTKLAISLLRGILSRGEGKIPTFIPTQEDISKEEEIIASFTFSSDLEKFMKFIRVNASGRFLVYPELKLVNPS